MLLISPKIRKILLIFFLVKELLNSIISMELLNNV